MRLKNGNKDEVMAMLEENERRLNLMFGYHNQLTGEGIEDHDWILTLTDYALRHQWLTDEFKDNPFFAKLKECGSIKAYIKWYEKKYDQIVGFDEVADFIFTKRCERDPAFAFYNCFKIQDKQTGNMIPFVLNYAQRVLLSKLERMRRANVPIRLVLLKARQWGGSTFVQLYMAWLQIFVIDGWNSVIIAQTKDTSRRIKGMYRKVLDNFPKFIFKKNLQFSSYEQSQGSDFQITDNKHNPVRSSVVTVASYENYENARGAAISMAHMSECAYWKTTDTKSPEALITNIDGGILVAPNTFIVLESTANGNSGYFYDQYQIAKNPDKQSIWDYLFIPFFFIENDRLKFKDEYERKEFIEYLIDHKDEEIQPDECHECGAYLWGLWQKGASLEHIKWYIQKRSGYTNHEQIASEAPSDDVECFAFSGNKIWSHSFIEAMRNEYKRIEEWKGDIRVMNLNKRELEWDEHAKVNDNWEVKLVNLYKESGGYLRIWKQPDALKTANQYVVTVDVGGRSEKADYSVITVINRWNTRRQGGQLEVVARWRGHLRYDLMAWKAVAIAKYYKDALLVFESNTFDKKKAEARDFVEQGDHIRGILNVIGDVYENLYTRPNTDAENIEEGNDRLIGFQTNKKTKQDIVDEFTLAFEDGLFIDHDDRFYAEAEIYEQRPDGSYGNIVGKDKHDDIVMTNMIGVYVHNRMDKPELLVEHKTRVNRELINESSF